MVSVEEVARVPFFKGIPGWALQQVAADGKMKHYHQNAFIIHQHDQSNGVYFLLSGSVQILMRFEGVDDLFTGKVSDYGALIGWSAFRPPFRYSASVRCEEDLDVLLIPKETFTDIVAKDQRVGYSLYQRVAAVLANRLEQTRELMIHADRSLRSRESASYLPS